jgi:hypothetical protein
MVNQIYELICDFCGENFQLTHANYVKRNATRRRTGYSHIVCSGIECRKKQRQDVIKVMHSKNAASNSWGIIGEFRRGKSYEELWGKEKADLAKKKIREARLTQPEPHLNKRNSESSKAKMSTARKKYLEKNPEYSEKHAMYLANRYMNLSPEEKLKFSLRGHEVANNMKRHTSHGKMLTWYGKEVWYESDYERMYFEMLNIQKIFWQKNTSLLVPYYDSKYYCIKHTKPDVLIYTENFEHLHTLVEIKPYDFLLNPKNHKSRYYQITKDKHDGLLGYCELYNLKMKFITELDLKESISIKNIAAFRYRKKRVQIYEEKLHKLTNIYEYKRPYFTQMTSFDADGYIIGSFPLGL